MFRRRWHQYIAVFLHKRGSAIRFLSCKITTNREVNLSIMDEITRRVCEKEGCKQNNLALLNLIYLGKGGDPNVRTMETSQPDNRESLQQETQAVQSQHQDPPTRGGEPGRVPLGGEVHM